MLELTHIDAAYGSVKALHDISVSVPEGGFVAIVGPNGAGKTTLFKVISGLVPVLNGKLQFKGRDLNAIAPARRAHLGIAHVPEGRQVFASLNVLENLEMGAYTQSGRQHWQENLEKIYTWFPVLKERSKQPAGTLSGGEQQMLAIGRGLAAQPQLMMLDEPSMGLSPAIADEIFERLIAIHRSSGLTLLLVEQRVAEALHYADSGYVLEAGRIILSGDQATLKGDARIRRAYLGM